MSSADRIFPEWFEAQVARTPDAAAVIYGQRSVSYRELNILANRIGHFLIAHSAGPEDIVGLAFPRSIEGVAAMLGIWKCGGAYLPLDVELPAARLAVMLADAAPACTLTAGREIGKLAGAKNLVVLDSPETAAELERCSTANVTSMDRLRPMTPLGPAYVIYTSGSTGAPKGVVVTHAGIAPLAMAQIDRFRIRPGSRILQFSSWSFDSFIAEFVTALGSGATLVLLDQNKRSGNELMDAIRESGATHVTLAPMVLATMEPTAGWPVETLIVAGDACPAKTVERWSGRCRMLNAYGPTESTVCATVSGALSGDVVPPIGRPLPHVRLYVLNSVLRPCEQDTRGEVYIAGAGLARGYLKAAGLSAARFVADPYGASGTRMYRTGDFARMRSDGEIEFLGREDGQVKIRGFRVELGEVDAALLAVDGVRQAATVAWEDETGSRRIAAYVVADPLKPRTHEELRELLAENLPDYMLPASTTFLEALPITDSGKLNRSALPKPEVQASTGFRAPRTPEEEILCGIFAEVLRLDRVGIDDNFFTLGGDSLLAVSTITRIIALFGARLDIGAVFESPTVAQLSRQLRQSDNCRTLPPAQPRTLVPLSSAQQRLWFLDRLQGSSTEYNVTEAIRLRGALQIAALERAFRTIIERHESLRTRFPETDGCPVQAIDPEPAIPFHVEDLSGLDAVAQQSRVAAAIREQDRRPFDLATGPLLRIKLLVLDPGNHVLIRTMHHIVADGWSEAIFARELEQLYDAYQAGRADPLPPLGVQYQDYARWQMQERESQFLETQLTYWKRQLAGIPPHSPLATDWPRTGVQTFEAGSCHVTLAADQWERLKRLTRHHHATPYMTLLAALGILLSRYTGETDIVIASPIVNRPFPELEGVIGLFLNAVLMRLRINSKMSFEELIASVRRTALEAYANQDLPFERLVRELAPERRLDASPLAQIVFAFQNAPWERERLGGIDAERLPIGELRVRNDLEVHALEHNGKLNLWWLYNRNLFATERMERMARHYLQLLESLSAEPGQPVGLASHMDSAERRGIIDRWSSARSEIDAPAVTELFETRAANQPRAVALAGAFGTLDYAALNEQANRLAHYLIAQGAGPEDLVALALPRSTGLIVAILAVWKSGAAYLPLDPAWPARRLSPLLEEARPIFVLSAADLVSKLPDSVPAILLDDPLVGAAVAASSSSNPTNQHRLCPLQRENPAYVLHTSGSTGTPKGVAITHRGLASLSAAQRQRLSISPRSRILQFASASFDASIWEIVMALTNGARLVLIRDEERSGTALRVAMVSHQVTHATLPPAVLASVPVSDAPGLDLLGLDLLIVAGEACPGALVAAWSGSCVMINAYGPTEATICATMSAPLTGCAAPDVGTPISNSRVYILDASLEPCPADVPGEIYIAGSGLARGYRNRPGATAMQFIADPYGAGGGRMYRTGDRARWRCGGQIEFIGRVDEQVKVHGVRIELGEVEAALLAHRHVQNAAVVVAGELEDRRLVAFVTRSTAEGLAVDDASLGRLLRDEVRLALPDSMAPSAVVVLDRLPLTPNGKIDRRALPTITLQSSTFHANAPEANAETGAAPTPEMEVLCSLFAEALRISKVWISDDFFVLGGHSLAAVSLVSRINSVFGVDLKVETLFESPTVQELAAQLESAPPACAPLTPQERPPQIPLSYAQQRLWFLQQLNPANPAYNVPLAWWLEGKLDADALRASIAEVARRHEVLRTHFEISEGVPRQVIEPVWAGPFRVDDLSGLEPDAAQARVQAIAADEAATPFDLSRGPLLRVRLLRLGKDRHALLMTAHHIVCDAWSMGIILGEFAALYGAFAKHGTSPLPEPRLQYADYTLWQRNWIDGEVCQEQLAYWMEAVAAAPDLTLPIDRPRRTPSTDFASTVAVHLSPELASRIRDVARQEGVTVFMVLLAAFQAVLARWAGCDEVSIGSVVANRRSAESERLVGFFVNTLVLRTDLRGNPSGRELLRRVREVCLNAYAHQDLPFERLIEHLNPRRDANRNPLFQVMFSLQHTAPGEIGLPGISLKPLVRQTPSPAKFDLDFVLHERGGQIDGALMYRSSLFQPERIERLARDWESLLEGMISDAGRPLRDFDFLTEAEHLQLRALATGPVMECPGLCAHELFGQQAQRTPDAVAVSFEHESRTYRDLDREASLLARYLRRAGVRPEASVALCTKRNLYSAIGMLAIWKAGGVYVPIDPECTAERARHILSDSKSSILLTEACLAHRFADAGVVMVEVDGDWPATSTRDPVPIDQQGAAPGDTAYIIYTSGTTGKQNGVAVSHTSLANTLLYVRDLLKLGPGDRMPVLASNAFDVSLLETWTPLLSGAEALILSKNDVLDPHRLSATLAICAAFHAVPSLMWLVLKACDSAPCEFPNLKTILVGGDAVRPDLLAKMRRTFASRDVRVLYGPTETSIICTVQEIGSIPEFTPLGRPNANAEIYVLDDELRLAPSGVAGEIYIGGTGLARGYVNQAALTAARFVANPHGAAGERLYRTGDRGRWREGELEFLGRRDEQVKIRGQRIELGEIAAVLREHAAVAEAVVVADDAGDPDAIDGGETRLVAYWVARRGKRTEPAELRRYLQQRLPEVMVPPDWMELPELPLNANGKLDRKRLRRPEPSRHTLRTGYVAPRTLIEELIAGVWSALLKRRDVGVLENFFEAGGHSLLATQLISQLRRLFGVELSIGTVFELPTVAGQAAAVEEAGRGAQFDQSPRLERVEDSNPVPLSFAQQRLWFMEELEPGSGAYNIPLGLRLRGRLDRDALEQAVREVIERHAVLRTRFEMRESSAVQVVEPQWTGSIEWVSLRGKEAREREEEFKHRAEEEAIRGFDLRTGPVIRAQVVEMGDDDHALLVTMHHIAGDGWSAGLLMRELCAIYEAREQKSASPLAPMRLQYRDFAVWQRQWLQGDVLERQLEYWKRQLDGVAVLELPIDHARPAVLGRQGARAGVKLSRELTEKLEELSRQQGVTLFMVLLAGLQIVLGKWAGQEDVAVGTDVANRRWPELEELIGFFINQLTLRTDLSGDPTVEALLGRVRTACLDAYGHQDLPFERLIEELNPERSLNRSPLFQVKFLLQNQPEWQPAMAGLQVHSIGLEKDRAHHDLMVNVAKVDGAISGVCVYSTELFDRPTVDRLVGHWVRTLEGMVQGRQRRISELEILSGADRRQLLEEWSGARETQAAGDIVTREFERQVKQGPGAVAVQCDGQALSYAELNARANRLARRLRALGVGPEALVAICLERSPELLVAIMGVLKAGGGYLPLDPGLPRERLAYMLEDSRTMVWITSSGLLQRLPTGWGPVICLDTEWRAFADEPPEDFDSGVRPDNTAYVMYTSGSAGKPKGVVVAHSSLANYLNSSATAYQTGAAGSVVHSSFGFDLTVTSLFLPLLLGGCVTLLPDEAGIDALVSLLSGGTGIGILKLTPSHLKALSPSIARQGVRIGALVIGGEALDCHNLADWLPGVQLAVNEYGPTETVVGCSIHRISPTDSGPAPIGRPIANTELYVLDTRMEPVPAGVAGEIWIGGAGLARGYFNRPGWTAERFVANPFGAPGSRLYRSGDLGRWNGSGVLEYLGRADEQVKIRGYRIEPGEIEAVLRDHSGVRNVAVICRQDEPGRKRLAAYLVARDTGALTPQEMRLYAESRLPDYMVPDAFVFLDELPLTVNGKLDRKAVPRPQDPAVDRAAPVAPRTPVEERLAEIWARVLGRERVGIDDNFFDLGGDSIMALLMVARARDAGLAMTVQQVFQFQTIAGVAGQLTPEAASMMAERWAPGSGEVDGGEVNRSKIPLTPIQHWFFERNFAEPWHWNQSVMLRPPEGISAEVVRKALAHLVTSHAALRLCFQQDEAGGWTQHYGAVPAGEDYFAVVHLAGFSRQEQLRWVEEEANRLQRDIKLDSGLLLRSAWFDLGAEGSRLLLVIHHLATDGVSWRILLHDLERWCDQLAAGEKPAVTSQCDEFAGWASALVEYSAHPQLEGQLEYWIAATAPTVCRLSTDFQGANEVQTAAALWTHLDEDETRVLLEELPRTTGARIHEALVTAVARVLRGLTGSNSVLIDLEGHGREELPGKIDVSHTIGWFTTLYPLRVELTGARLHEDLNAVKETMRSVPLQGLGFGVLRYLHAQGRERLKDAVQPEVVVNYLGQFDPLVARWQMAAGPMGEQRSREGLRQHLLEVSAHVSGGCLRIEWQYNRALQSETAICQISSDVVAELRRLVALARSREHAAPSDFPMARVSQSDIDRILTRRRERIRAGSAAAARQ